MIKHLSTSILILLLTSCSSNKKVDTYREFSRTFKAPYETVWRATQQALLNYPMNINNMDTGHLQTLYITGKHRFKPPHQRKTTLPSGYQYRLNIHILHEEEKSKILIHKEVRMLKDFFSQPKNLASDGFEEKTIMYRIKREIIIDKILNRELKKRAKNQAKDKSQDPNQPKKPTGKKNVFF